MNKKIFYILAIVLIIILLAAVAYLFYVKKINLPGIKNIVNQQKNVVNNNVAVPITDQAEEIKKININNQVQPTTDEKVVVPVKKKFGKEEVAGLAASFAERYGSYSNQANFRNITDLKMFMTRKMQIWADSYLSEQRAASSSTNIYYGIITKAVAKEIKEYDEDSGQASILVHTRRQEAIGSTSNISNTFNQDIIIDLLKENDIWKIDNAKWENK